MTVHAMAPQPAARPRTVTSSAGVLLGQTAVGLAMAAIAVASVSLVSDRYHSVTGAAGTSYDQSQYILTVRIYCITLIVYSIITAVTSAALVVPVLRGSRTARTLTFIACLAFTLGGLCGGFALMLSRQMRFGMSHTDAYSGSEVSPPSVADLIGPGLWILLVLLAVLQVALVVAAAMLLTAKPSAAFFARPAAPVHRPVGAPPAGI